MSDSASPLLSSQSHSRWFYSVTSLGLLALMFVGFQLFYLHGQAYPGRPLTPPIRTLVITHACLMTLWMLLRVTRKQGKAPPQRSQKFESKKRQS